MEIETKDKTTNIMNVLSLFDGMSGGQIALKELGIMYDKYFASEIKPCAIKVTRQNFPDTIHIGDVKKVFFIDGVLKTEKGIFYADKIDLLIGGSPCQDISVMMKNRKGISGDQSKLFYEYIRIKNEVEPRYFLLENVGSCSNEDANEITKMIGVDGIRINSSLVSAQMRDRIYWTNIPGESVDLFGGGKITQPNDKKIMLNDILESGSSDKDKAYCVLSRSGGSWSHVNESNLRSERNQKQLLKRYNKGFINAVQEDGYFRLLSKKEVERLQTVPEGYTNCLNYADACNVLGDGWTIDVIKHIFKGLTDEII